MKKNVLNHVFHFAPRHARQQNSMYERGIKTVEPAIDIAVTVEDSLHQQRLWRDRWALFPDHLCVLSGHQKGICRCLKLIHGAVFCGFSCDLLRLLRDTLKTGGVGRVLTSYYRTDESNVQSPMSEGFSSI